MKEILKDPFLLSIIIGMSAIYILLTYNAAAKNPRMSLGLGRFFAGIFLFAISGATGVTVMPFKKLHPQNLANFNTTPMTIIMQLGIYAVFLIILSPRLSQTFKNLLQVGVSVIISAPYLAVILSLISLSFFWSDTPTHTIKASLVILETAGVAIYIGKQNKWDELYPFIRYVNLFVLLYSLTKTSPTAEGNWTGILGHKNQFSFFMAQTAVLWLVHAIYSPKQRNFSIIIFMLALIGLQKGGSGASKVLVLVLFSLWGYLGGIKKMPVRVAFVSFILFLIVSISLGMVILNNLEAIVVDGLGKDMTLTGRTEFWPQIVDKINQRPLLGYGVGGFWQPWRGIDNPAANIIIVKSQFKPPHSHNGFLDLACDLGWVGLGLFVISFFINIARGVVYLTRAKMPEAGLPLLLLTYILMTNLTETGVFAVSSVWFWYIVVTVRLSLDTAGKT
ncbi:O-antigen ligase family protein [Kamptonema formosum]|uniref:O-antigen ligase family protein n=1 Tax=Kamptonema formosum TaxID=331992 RepID=UPI0003494BAE|nr:O-antigen ligase family protein [Oscillatoria sp. PCC 10802]